jgi:hypothetical protein
MRTTYYDRNKVPGLGQAQQCCGVKPVNVYCFVGQCTFTFGWLYCQLMYVYHVNNGDPNLSCVLCVPSVCLVYDKHNKYCLSLDLRLVYDKHNKYCLSLDLRLVYDKHNNYCLSLDLQLMYDKHDNYCLSLDLRLMYDKHNN